MNSTPEQPDKTPKSTYVVDTESGAEMARLLRQDQLITAGMGGIFPEKVDLTDIHDVLDLACGPGGWAMETAVAYPEMQVVGVDISEKMVSYAQVQTQVQHLPNVSFQVMDIVQPLAFPDASFDLVNIRFVSYFLLRDKWDGLVREGLRLLRPGGILRFTEVEPGCANKLHFEKVWWTVSHALQRNNLGFSPNGLHLNTILELPKLFRDAGVRNIEKLAHFIEYSTGTEARDGFYYDFVNGFQAVGPYIEKSGLATAEEWRDLTQQGLAEMFEDDFCAGWFLLTVWGRR